jgi:glycosyltransferase involved in cell wall biosynthesis
MPTPSVTAVIVNFQTPDLTRRAASSLRRWYPDLPLLLIDNGSADDSPSLLRRLAEQSPAMNTLLCNPRNIHHGPAMDQAMRRLSTEEVFFLDSDCVITSGGILERLREALHADDRNYAAGKRIFMNSRGFDVTPNSHAHPYIRPICMLLRRRQYLALPPFERHGAPCLTNMIAATAAGLWLAHVPVDDYVQHEGRGTAARFGYGLGWKGKLNHVLNRLGL